MYVVTKTLPDGNWQKIASCKPHILKTMSLLGTGGKLTVTKVDPLIHTCKGCLEKWPVSASAARPVEKVRVLLPVARSGDRGH